MQMQRLGYWLNGPRLNPAGVRKYFLFVISRVAMAPSQPRIQRVPELFPEHDVDHSPPSNAKLKNEWRCNYTASCYGRRRRCHFYFYGLQTHNEKSHRLHVKRCSVVLLRLSKEISRHWNNYNLSWQFFSVSQWPRLTGASTKQIGIRTVLFWAVIQRVVVISYLRFGTTCV